jgi:DHA1 family bicyclomycin/chloramphenicol resistance-like MFS transporter
MIGTAFTAAAGALILGLIWGGIVTAASVIIPTVIYFFGMGLSQPNIQAGAISPFPQMAGAAASLLGLAQYISAGLFSIIIGVFAFDPTLLLATVMGGSGIFAFVVFTSMIWIPLRGND